MSDKSSKDQQKDDQKKDDHAQCACCGPTDFEFPEELMTPEIKAFKESMSPEEFQKLMEAMM